VDRWERLPLWAIQAALPGEVRAALRAQRLQNNPLGLANSLRGLGTGRQPPLWDHLAALACPTFLVAGREDAKFATLAEEMATLIPRSEVLIVHGAGHTVHLEQPAVFNRLVRDFLLEQQDTSDVEGV
jgi:pimeloyl-ACP methyl ester carboxylesterase